MTLAGFREWTSDEGTFPETGRIAFLVGEVIVDLSPPLVISHGQVKLAVNMGLLTLIKLDDLGAFYPSGVRIVNVDAQLSDEPDAIFATWGAFEEGKLRKVRTKDGKDYIELEGTPDWVLEVVGPSSVEKDGIKLRQRYHMAGIPEYWLIDARGDEISFEILVRHPAGYQSKRLKSGWRQSAVFGKQFRLVRRRDQLGDWAYRLEMK